MHPRFYVLIVALLISCASSGARAQQNRTALAGFAYLEEGGQWYMEAEGRQGSRVLTERLVALRHDRADIGSADFAAASVPPLPLLMDRFPDGYHVLGIPSGLDPFAVAQAFWATGAYADVHFDVVWEAQSTGSGGGLASGTPDDEYYTWQWAIPTMQADRAREITVGSEEIVVAVIDTAIDYDHPDLFGNVWVNPGEDLNGNGVIDPEEINDVDDDGNGPEDDFYGWDFWEGDNNPDPIQSPTPDSLDVHGTNMVGIIGAVANNDIGIAGVAGGDADEGIPGVRVMALRAGARSELTLQSQAAAALRYATDNGAHVVSMSISGLNTT